MTLNSADSHLASQLKNRTGKIVFLGIGGNGCGLTLGLLLLAVFFWADPSRAVLLWSDLGSTQVHETGPGSDILGGGLRRDDSATDTLYFKFHVDPVSDASTEPYFAAFQLFERN